MVVQIADEATEQATLPIYPVATRRGRAPRYRRRHHMALESTRARHWLLAIGVATTLAAAMWFGPGPGSRSNPVAPPPLPSPAAAGTTARPAVTDTSALAIHERCGRRLGNSGC